MRYILVTDYCILVTCHTLKFVPLQIYLLLRGFRLRKTGLHLLVIVRYMYTIMHGLLFVVMIDVYVKRLSNNCISTATPATVIVKVKTFSDPYL